jgi:hypothetical protein
VRHQVVFFPTYDPVVVFVSNSAAYEKKELVRSEFALHTRLHIGRRQAGKKVRSKPWSTTSSLWPGKQAVAVANEQKCFTSSAVTTDRMGKLLQSTCLKPQYSLRRQLVVTFGSIAFLTIAIVVLLSTITAQRAGEVVQNQARSSSFLKLQVENEIRSTTAYLADVISRRFANLDGAALIQHEIVRDRIVGYPDRGWENDTHVPFLDMKSQKRVYPITSPSLQRDWNLTGEFNLSGLPEHLRDGIPDTSTAMYIFQGNCDPDETRPTEKEYYPNCTSANNDVNTGGVVHPVPSNQYIAEKAANIGTLLKPLWESHTDILHLRVGFHNSGAGGDLWHPSFRVDGTVTHVSQGCEWMSQTNPLTGKSYSSQTEIERCHPRGTRVSERDCNPLEQDWCIDQALHPGEVRSVGPFFSASNSMWLIGIGKAVFDRM